MLSQAALNRRNRVGARCAFSALRTPTHPSIVGEEPSSRLVRDLRLTEWLLEDHICGATAHIGKLELGEFFDRLDVCRAFRSCRRAYVLGGCGLKKGRRVHSGSDPSDVCALAGFLRVDRDPARLNPC